MTADEDENLVLVPEESPATLEQQLLALTAALLSLATLLLFFHGVVATGAPSQCVEADGRPLCNPWVRVLVAMVPALCTAVALALSIVLLRRSLQDGPESPGGFMFLWLLGVPVVSTFVTWSVAAASFWGDAWRLR